MHTLLLQMTPLPEGWSVTERPDDAQVSLTREYNGEVIQVDFLAREDVSHLARLCSPRHVTSLRAACALPHA